MCCPPLLVDLSSMDSKMSRCSVQFASAGWDQGPLVSLSVWSLLSWMSTSSPASTSSQWTANTPLTIVEERLGSLSGIGLVWPGWREFVWLRGFEGRSQFRAKPLTGEIIIHDFKLPVTHRPCHRTFRPTSVIVYDSIKMTFEISAPPSS